MIKKINTEKVEKEKSIGTSGKAGEEKNTGTSEKIEKEKNIKNSGKAAGKLSEGSDREILVSISCIAYNHEKYLRDALSGFLMQECDFGYEILIHDDASTDGTADIIREYEKKYPDIIKPLIQAENQYSKGIKNISGAFNFPRARGKYIAMCEGDDFWVDPHKLKLQAEYMEAHPECSMCFHAARIIGMDGAFRGKSLIRPYKGNMEVSPEGVISKKENYPTASLMIRTEYAKRLPGYYFDCPVGDIPLQLYMASVGSAYYIDRIMSAYRAGAEGSWSADIDSGDSKRKWESHFSAMKKLYEEFDRETCGRYHGAAKEAAARVRFLTDLNTGKLSSLFERENRGFAKELPLLQRSLLKLDYRFPAAWRLLRRAFFSLKGAKGKLLQLFKFS